MRSLTVPAAGGPLRLDLFLTGHVPDCSRRSAQRAIAMGAVRINGRRARKSQSVSAGDVIDVPDELFVHRALQPNPQLEVAVLYEDAAVIALDKPAGMASHALRADETDTAANFLLARYPELAGVGKNDREPGLVHRLDTDTSGVLLAARTPEAYRALRAQFAAHQVTKEYLALVDGDIAVSGTLRTPLTHDPHNRRKMRACSESTPHARAAVTTYRPLERFGHRTLLAVEIPTGVMHQIRVHLASIGHPIIGDGLYGKPPPAAPPPRHLLHAQRVAFTHPETGQRTAITSPLPPDFAAVLEESRKKPPAFTGNTRQARQRERRGVPRGRHVHDDGG
jgi:23S rRNA pseudouridine1911/1915/1917 synthase